jgi:hypothetical protein
MILHPGEQGIASEPVLGGGRPDWQSGTLYLTSQRLVFEGLVAEVSTEPTLGGLSYRQRAVMVPQTLLELQLTQITNLLAVPGHQGRHTLRVEAGRGYNYVFAMPNPQNWVGPVLSARTAALTAAASAQGNRTPQHFGGAPGPAQPMVYLHCTHCGSLNSAGIVRCSSCGAAL